MVLALSIFAIGFGCDREEHYAVPVLGGRSDSGVAGQGGSGGTASIGIDGGVIVSDGGTTRASVVCDATSPIPLAGRPLTVECHVDLENGMRVSANSWSVDDTRIGSIGADGVLHVSGYVGGLVTVSATVASTVLSAALTFDVTIDEPGGVAPADQTALRAGGTGDPGFRWLYPYEGTVFPRGLMAPELQFAGTAADATYLEISAPHFTYRQFAGAASPLRIAIPASIWRGLTLTVAGADLVKVSATKRSGGQVSKAIASSWRIAPASLKGIIYYSTYKTKLAQGNGAIMRVRPGGNAEVVQSGCTVCHSVSANGNVLATGIDYFAVPGAPAADPDDNPVDSAAFDLSPDGTVVSRTRSTEGRLLAFAALTPDGSKALTNGIPASRWPPFIMRGVYSIGGFASRLVDTRSGQVIAAPTLSQYVTYAQTPAFAPDGSRLAFVNGDRLEQRVLTVLDVDLAANPPLFSNPRDLVTQNGSALAWPTMLPDASAVVYHEGDSFDSNLFVANNAPSPPQHAEVRLVDVETKALKPLNALNGKSPTGEVYLPYGAGVEGRMNYEPSVLPVAVGGYYWILFTSRRAYGNTVAPGGSVPRGDDAWGNESDPSPRKKIWIAALDIDHRSAADPSHPAFYVPGQELEAGNMRAYAALAPCKANGAACESGADCCEGFCRETGRTPEGQPMLACVPPPPNTCSHTDERCLTKADCCDPTESCINNRCSTPSIIY